MDLEQLEYGIMKYIIAAAALRGISNFAFGAQHSHPLLGSRLHPGSSCAL